jgi:exodeoxyribonuclease V alpha subunit
VTEGPSPYDARYARRASGLLGAFNRADVLSSADVHVAATLGRLTGEADERVLLAVALTVRAVRRGSVCIDLEQESRLAAADSGAGDALAWPDLGEWYDACRASPMVAAGADEDPDRPVRQVGRLLYLDRYWRQERLVAAEVDRLAALPPRTVDRERLRRELVRLFPGEPPDGQRLAAAACAVGAITVVTGGPGTGKTTTVARIVALLGDVCPEPLRVALAAPTAKAAARLQEAVAAEHADLQRAGLPAPGALPASTLHRLLGARPGSHTRFRHDRTNRLPFDLVVVDETSMVSLTMMSRLVEALRPDAALVLVGDPDQLASVEAGAVLGDLVRRSPPPARDARLDLLRDLLPADVSVSDPELRGGIDAEMRRDVVRLRSAHRYGEQIAGLAEAIRAGDADRAVGFLTGGGAAIEWVPAADVARPDSAALASLRADVVDAGRAQHRAAAAGKATDALVALERHRLLCAHRRGPYGAARWSRVVQRWLEHGLDGDRRAGLPGGFCVGQPLIATANDYEKGLYNGDTGVVVDSPERGPVAVFGRGGEPVQVAANRLADVETMHALTVHRSQGSQFESVSVVLPEPESPLLTRELLYTAVSRAKTHVRVIGAVASVRAAVARPIVRSSGLRQHRSVAG